MDEENNCGPWTGIGVGTPPPKPDLTALTVTPTSGTVGSVPLSATIVNSGPVATTTGFSNFLQVTQVNPNDVPPGTNIPTTDLPSVSMGALGAGANDTLNQNYVFPGSGNYYVRACADKSSSSDAGTIDESNEVNNCGAWTGVVIGATTTGGR